MIAYANGEITEEMLQEMNLANVKKFKTIYTNEIDHGPFISSTLRLEASTHSGRRVPAEDSETKINIYKADIYRMMRPGEPPTKDATESLFENIFSNPERYNLSTIGRMKFNSRIGGNSTSKKTILDRDDIINVLQTLIAIRSGRDTVDDIDNLGNRRVRRVGEMVENVVRIGLTRIERVVRERLILAEAENLVPQKLINSKPVTAALREFFGSKPAVAVYGSE